jgi:hypothetical protein
MVVTLIITGIENGVIDLLSSTLENGQRLCHKCLLRQRT